jgi:NACalpha-BTF3-like transcription factor
MDPLFDKETTVLSATRERLCHRFYLGNDRAIKKILQCEIQRNHPFCHFMTERVASATEYFPEGETRADCTTSSSQGSRAERKMNEFFLKFSLTAPEKVVTVTTRKSTQDTWTFNKPGVYFIENVYVVFGDLDEKDLYTAVSQTNVSRTRAIESLRNAVPQFPTTMKNFGFIEAQVDYIPPFSFHRTGKD